MRECREHAHAGGSYGLVQQGGDILLLVAVSSTQDHDAILRGDNEGRADMSRGTTRGQHFYQAQTFVFENVEKSI